MAGERTIRAGGRRRVLLTHDDPVEAEVIAAVFRRGLDWEIDVAHGMRAALRTFRSEVHSAVFIDLTRTTNGTDQLEMCRSVRARSDAVGVIVLTDRHTPEDQLAVFDAGADDCVPKPVAPEVLVARARAVTRRASRPPSSRDASRLAPILDERSGVARGPLGTVQLTKTEIALLIHCRAAGPQPRSADAIAASFLGRKDRAARNLIHRHIANVRRKLACAGLTDGIVHTALGYVARVPLADPEAPILAAPPGA